MWCGCSYIYALAARGQAGVEHLLDLIAADLRVTMILTGARTVADIDRNLLATAEGLIRRERHA